jgi:hypothetical protein
VRVLVLVVFMTCSVGGGDGEGGGLHGILESGSSGGTDDENAPRASVVVPAIALASQKKMVPKTFVFVFVAFELAMDSEPSSSSNNIEESVELVGLSNGAFEPWLLHHISIFHVRSNSTRPAPPPLFDSLHRFLIDRRIPKNFNSGFSPGENRELKI